MPARAATPARIEGYASSVGDADPRLSLPELIFGVVSDALRAAGCTMSDMDGVVIADHDLIDGRSLSSMITGPASGAYLRDEIRVSDDGLVAVSLGAARIEAGEASKIIVASWGRASEGDVERASHAAYDPVTEQPLGLSDRAVSALRASAYLRRHGCPARDRAASERQRRAEANPRRPNLASRCEPVFPLRPEESGLLADVAAAVVLGTEGSHAITGIGHGTDPARIGDRDLTRFDGASTAIAAAFAAAGRRPAEVTVAELGGSTLFDDALLLEAAGFAAPGSGVDFYADNTWVNYSGGTAAGDCYPCRGLLRMVDALRQLDAQAELTATHPAVALVAAGSAVADQTATAVIIEAR